MTQIPVGMSHDDLADLLVKLAQHVRQHDSLEGSIEWHWPSDDKPNPAPVEWPSDDNDVWVHGAVRVGNRDGQGGMLLLGHYR